jgi:hypothetical protein
VSRPEGDADRVSDDTKITPGSTSGGVQPAGAGRSGVPVAGQGVQNQASPPGPAGPKKTGFFSTRNGRLVMIAGAVAALLVVAGVAAALFIAVLGVFANKPQAPVPAASTAQAPAASTTSSESVAGASPSEVAIAPITNVDVYTVRDPFQPVISQQVATATASTSTTSSSTTTSSSSSTTTGTAGDENTITLVSIDDDGQATFTVGNATYVAGAGERLGTTPWQVVSIGDDYAVVLYGDEQVTLIVGEGISK